MHDVSGIGRATIERYMLDGTRCGMNQGRHAAWNWAYEVVCIPLMPMDLGRTHLSEARRIAALHAPEVVERWTGGKRFVRGPRGGLRRNYATEGAR